MVKKNSYYFCHLMSADSFKMNFSEYQQRIKTVWIQIRPYVLLGLIWVQLFAKVISRRHQPVYNWISRNYVLVRRINSLQQISRLSVSHCGLANVTGEYRRIIILTYWLLVVLCYIIAGYIHSILLKIDCCQIRGKTHISNSVF